MPRTARATGKSPYSVHPAVTMVQNTIAQMKTRTGRSLDEWVAIIKKSGPPSEEARKDWLKKQHGLGTNYSAWIAGYSVGKCGEDADPKAYLKAAAQYVEDMFAGPRTGLRPLYDALLKLSLSLGKDVKACPCQTMVPIFRNHVIAQIKPATRTRIDFGLALKDTKAAGRLINTGGHAKKDRITHRVAIQSLDDINADVKRWLKAAYEMDA